MNKKFLTPVALAVTALLAASPASATTQNIHSASSIERASTALGLNSFQDTLVVEKANNTDMRLAGHYSHSSHQSHSSHYSHTSHYSSSY